jgi:hypothetical protein
MAAPERHILRNPVKEEKEIKGVKHDDNDQANPKKQLFPVHIFHKVMISLHLRLPSPGPNVPELPAADPWYTGTTIGI